MPLALLAFMFAAAAQPAAAAAPQAETELSERLPAGAPKDDYGFVAWCDGVLSGHMDLAQRVKDVLPLDPVQEKIGSAYLAAYKRALEGSKEASTAAGRKRAEAVREVGWNNWDKARKADKQLAADTYLAWQLPGRCEHAAIRLSGDKDLFRMSPTADEVEAMGEASPVAGSHAAATAEADAVARQAPAPVEASADDLKISTLPDPPAKQVKSELEKKADAQQAKDDFFERNWNDDHSTTTDGAHPTATDGTNPH